MNRNQGLLGLLIFVLGVSVGWVSRGIPHGSSAVAHEERNTPAKTASAPAATETGEAPVAIPGKRAIRDTAPKKEKGIVFDSDSTEGKEMQERVGKMLGARKRTQIEQRIEKLVGELNLSAAQKSKLTSWLDERIAKLEASNLTDPLNATKSINEVSEAGLEELLAGNLTQDQQTAFAGLKEREKQGKINAMALKSLSQLQGVIEFEEGQRDEVYKALASSAEERIQREQDSPNAEFAMMGDFGVDIDPYGLGIQEAMQDAFKPDGEGKMPADAQTRMQGVIDRCIDEKVEKLRPLLNDKQLEQYRAELKTKGAGLFGNMLLNEGVSHDATIEIPAK